jgi:hypothetical protein
VDRFKRLLVPSRSGSIAEALNEGEDIALGLGAGLVLAMMNELGLEGVEETLHRGIVEAVGPCGSSMR